MAIILTDDGTLDTVLRCEECDEEMRYNYDGCPENHPQEDECAHYQRFVEWAIEDATEDHACPAAPGAEPTEPQEDDITTSDHKAFYPYGKRVFDVTETASGYKLMGSNKAYPSIEHAIRAYRDRVQFWPDVWFISDHGNAHRIDLTEGKG